MHRRKKEKIMISWRNTSLPNRINKNRFSYKCSCKTSVNIHIAQHICSKIVKQGKTKELVNLCTFLHCGFYRRITWHLQKYDTKYKIRNEKYKMRKARNTNTCTFLHCAGGLDGEAWYLQKAESALQLCWEFGETSNNITITFA